MPRQEPTTITILGANTVVENALAQLLTGEGYSTRVIKTSPLREALEGQEEEMPSLGVGGGGVDLVVLAPSLSSRECDAFLAARRRPSSSPPIPVIALCSPMREPPTLLEEDGAARSVSWPTTAEHLASEIEDILLEARFPAHRESHRRRRSSSREGGIRR